MMTAMKVSEAAWVHVRGCLAPSSKMSEAAWLRLTKCPRLPGSVLQNVRGRLAPSYKMSEAAWLRLKVKTSKFPWQPVGISKFRLREVALWPKDLYCAKSRYDRSRIQGGVSAQTFSVSEDAWLRLLSNYSKIFRDGGNPDFYIIFLNVTTVCWQI